MRPLLSLSSSSTAPERPPDSNIYSPAEISARKKHKQRERHQSHNFKEGWVEYLDKRVARSVAEMLNAQTIGKFFFRVPGQSGRARRTETKHPAGAAR